MPERNEITSAIENDSKIAEHTDNLFALLKLIVSLEMRVAKIEEYLQNKAKADRDSAIRLKEKMEKAGFKFEEATVKEG
jgi:hypothetical protein